MTLAAALSALAVAVGPAAAQDATPPPEEVAVRGHRGPGPRVRREALIEVTEMKDVVFVSVVVAFFLLSWLYVKVCERL